MMTRYAGQMKQRFLVWGLASIVFVVTLGFSSWHEGLWASSDPPAPTTHRNRPVAVESDDTAPMPAQPFAPDKPATAAVPAIAAVTASPPPSPVETPPPVETPREAPAVPDMDEAEFRAHEERATQRGERSR
jgi:hypothetical protein